MSEELKFKVIDFETPETEIEKWILGDIIETLNIMREQSISHASDGDVEESKKYERGIIRILNLQTARKG